MLWNLFLNLPEEPPEPIEDLPAVRDAHYFTNWAVSSILGLIEKRLAADMPNAFPVPWYRVKAMTTGVASAVQDEVRALTKGREDRTDAWYDEEELWNLLEGASPYVVADEFNNYLQALQKRGAL